ncbi:hypothetical protein [Actinocrispum wychmicini]|uniref:Uncharacterized protein n=1 Tax=Actinocrispum wychmicini TaxID=1213861 RepID=A0A4R2JZF0_9PSEU|nr:hypothetical protein [Actinocrispum wychmicini]TCO59505.1 hypothetical protein EV192_104347 [Actinocrispum wychmicini]
MTDPEMSAAVGPQTPAGLRRQQVYLLVGVLLLLANVPLACLIWLWPDRTDLAGPHQMSLFWWSFTISPERRILLCVAFCGLLGGSIRMLLRIRGDFTSPNVSPRYVPWYFLTPPIGAILAMGFYLVVRGGFLASGTSADNVNVFAFGGTGVLVGLFAEKATDRLEAAFGGAFASRQHRSQPRSGHTSGDPEPTGTHAASDSAEEPS